MSKTWESRDIVLLSTVIGSLGILGLSALLQRLQQPAAAVVPGSVRRLAEALFSKAGGQGSSSTSMHMPTVASPELREVGAPNIHDGERQFSDRRLYMQLRVLEIITASTTVGQFIEDLKKNLASVPSVLYVDASSSTTVALLTWSEDPTMFAVTLNQILGKLSSKFTQRPGWTMFGKTYSNGHEKDLEEYLFKKPIRNTTRDDYEWAVWYPLRRKGPFYVQPPADQCRMLLHHAAIGKSFSDLGAAHDIRLKCFGMDGQDNEYVVGLVGDNLHGLSRVVEEMRKTKHTAEYIDSLGPFFVGKKIWKSPLTV